MPDGSAMVAFDATKSQTPFGFGGVLDIDRPGNFQTMKGEGLKRLSALEGF